ISLSQVVIFSRWERLAPSPAKARSSRARHSRAWSCAVPPAAALPRAVTPEQRISFAPPPSGTTRAGGNSGFWLIGRISLSPPSPPPPPRRRRQAIPQRRWPASHRPAHAPAARAPVPPEASPYPVLPPIG